MERSSLSDIIQITQAPWNAFPGRQADEVFWKQGDAEPFMAQFFAFWDGLSNEAKNAYLDYWRAPENWRSYLEPGGVLDEIAEIDRQDGFV